MTPWVFELKQALSLKGKRTLHQLCQVNHELILSKEAVVIEQISPKMLLIFIVDTNVHYWCKIIVYFILLFFIVSFYFLLCAGNTTRAYLDFSYVQQGVGMSRYQPCSVSLNFTHWTCCYGDEAITFE